METPPATPEIIETIEQDFESVFKEFVVDLPVTPIETPSRHTLGRSKTELNTAPISSSFNKYKDAKLPISPPNTPTSQPKDSLLEKSELVLTSNELSTSLTPPQTPRQNRFQFQLQIWKIESRITSTPLNKVTEERTLSKFELPLTPTESLYSSPEGENKRILPLSNATIMPIFCCPNYSSYFVDKAPFLSFSGSVTKGITPVKPRDCVHISLVNHVIELLPFQNSVSVEIPSRFFACVKPSFEYREVPPDFFQSYKDKKEVNFKVRSWFICSVHRKYHELHRHEHRDDVTVGYGLKEPELSPRQRAMDKRRFLIRKLTYGMEME